jgi:hypothetical protein
MKTFEVRMCDGSSWYVDEGARKQIVDAFVASLQERHGLIITLDEGVLKGEDSAPLLVEGPIELFGSNIAWIAPMVRNVVEPD